MALVEETLFGRTDKVEKAVQRLKAFEPPEGYYLAFSGGKDSQCIYHLAKRAGVKFDAHYAVTSVDPPELVRFIREHYPDVKFEYNYWDDGKPEHYFKDGKPKPKTMWNLIADHTIPPTRQARYCCAELKEPGGKGRIVITGVRWSESVRRRDMHAMIDIRTTSKRLHEQSKQIEGNRPLAKSDSIGFMDDNDDTRKMVEQCYTKKKTTINPIVDWLDEDVWEYLNEWEKVPHCSLYDPPLNYRRLGCIGCPLGGRKNMLRDFARYPGYKAMYIRAFDEMLRRHPHEIRIATGDPVDENSDAGGGVLKYTTDGCSGTTDGGNSGHCTGQSVEGDPTQPKFDWSRGGGAVLEWYSQELPRYSTGTRTAAGNKRGGGGTQTVTEQTARVFRWYTGMEP